MDNYQIKMFARAFRDLDGIYAYLAQTLQEPVSADHLLDALEEAIFSLEQLPHRGAPRKTGAYAGKGYRQLFVKNFTIVYRVEEMQKQVLIVTVRYARSEF